LLSITCDILRDPVHRKAYDAGRLAPRAWVRDAYNVSGSDNGHGFADILPADILQVPSSTIPSQSSGTSERLRTHLKLDLEADPSLSDTRRQQQKQENTTISWLSWFWSWSWSWLSPSVPCPSDTEAPIDASIQDKTDDILTVCATVVKEEEIAQASRREEQDKRMRHLPLVQTEMSGRRKVERRERDAEDAQTTRTGD